MSRVMRRVRTPEGAKFYGAPIGSPIVKDKVTGKLRALVTAKIPESVDGPRPGLSFTHRRMPDPGFKGSGVPPKALCRVTSVDREFVHFKTIHGRGEFKIRLDDWYRDYGSGPLIKHHVPDSFLDKLIEAGKQGGFTADLREEEFIHEGFAVSRTGQGDHFNVNSDDIHERIEAYIDQHWTALASDAEVFLGGWVDSETGEMWLDISEVTPDQDTAYERAKQRGEIAIANLGEYAAGRDGEIRIRYDKRPPKGTPAHTDWMDNAGRVHTYPVEEEFEIPKGGVSGTPEYLYRAVSEEDWQGITSREYMQSDGRMNLEQREGTVAADHDPTWYLPSAMGAQGRVLKIRMSPEDEWWRDTDGYWKTRKKIPLARVEAVTPQRVGLSSGAARPEQISPRDVGLGVENGINNALIKAFPGYDYPDEVMDFKDALYQVRRVPLEGATRQDAQEYVDAVTALVAQQSPEVREAVEPVLAGARTVLTHIAGDDTKIRLQQHQQEREADMETAKAFKASREVYERPEKSLADPMPDRRERAAKRAKVYLALADKNEPAISEVLQRMSKQVGGEMFGFEFRRKSEESATRKIHDKSIAKKVDPEDYPMGDSLRYTVLLPEASYTEGLNRIVEALQEQGNQVVSLENQWAGASGYRGINMELQTADGLTWELQFHTGASASIKDAAHIYYEIARAQTYTEEDRLEAHRRMMRLWSEAPRPRGWETIGNPVVKPMRIKKGYADAIKELMAKYPSLSKAQAQRLRQVLDELAVTKDPTKIRQLRTQRDRLVSVGKAA